MRISSPLLNSHSHSYPWLTTLKASQLQRIAQATGIQSSGTKASLIARLREELPVSSREPEPEKQMRTCKSTGMATGTVTGMSMSILSIDMGIQNLAYAHLLVSHDTPTTTTTGAGAPAPVTVKLNAWRRLAVSEALVGVTDSPSSSSSPGKTKGEAKEKVTSKHTFSPPEYARTAYTLINSLLHRYQPSHVLIERQRFRSGGGSAVQEWTLRVGVFEGMLYAVLYALGRERQRGAGAGAEPGPVVLGVEPRRAGAYWEDRLGLGSGLGSTSEGRGKGKKASKEGKKVKINLAGEWLRAGVIMGGGDSPVRLSVADDPELRALVDAYLRRWAGKSNPKTSVSKVKAEAGGQGQGVAEDDGPVIGPPDVRKMDDLADCLVQGVTWLEWQAMRQRISTEGLDAVLRLENGKL